jgi:hypothetical protein
MPHFTADIIIILMFNFIANFWTLLNRSRRSGDETDAPVTKERERESKIIQT